MGLLSNCLDTLMMKKKMKTNSNAWKKLYEFDTQKQNARVRNPLLAEEYDQITAEILYYQQIATDAWDNHYDKNDYPPEMSAYYHEHINPLEEKLKSVTNMLHCKHKDIENNGEYLYCLNCGAVDYGRGWQYYRGEKTYV